MNPQCVFLSGSAEPLRSTSRSDMCKHFWWGGIGKQKTSFLLHTITAIMNVYKFFYTFLIGKKIALCRRILRPITFFSISPLMELVSLSFRGSCSFYCYRTFNSIFGGNSDIFFAIVLWGPIWAQREPLPTVKLPKCHGRY